MLSYEIVVLIIWCICLMLRNFIEPSRNSNLFYTIPMNLWLTKSFTYEWYSEFNIKWYLKSLEDTQYEFILLISDSTQYSKVSFKFFFSVKHQGNKFALSRPLSQENVCNPLNYALERKLPSLYTIQLALYKFYIQRNVFTNTLLWQKKNTNIVKS